MSRIKKLTREELVKLPLPNGKEHISFSEEKEWIECSYKHKLKYIDLVSVDKDTVYTCFGDALHAACEDYLKTKIMKFEIALAKLKDHWENNKFEDLGLWMKRAKNILDGLPQWLEITFPDWECVEAEEFLYETIPESEHVNVKFKGYIDGIIKCGEKYWILDWKTAGLDGWSEYKRNDDITKLQLVYYNLFWSRKHNISPENINCAFVLLNRETGLGAKLPYELLPVKINEAQKRYSLTVLDNMITCMKMKRSFKIAKDDNRGPCRFCEFNKTKHCW